MPSEILARIPLPSLKVYSSASLLLMAGCLYYSYSVVTTDPGWKQNINTTVTIYPAKVDDHASDNAGGETKQPKGSENSTLRIFWDMLSFMGQEVICIWVSFVCLINTLFHSRICHENNRFHDKINHSYIESIARMVN